MKGKIFETTGYFLLAGLPWLKYWASGDKGILVWAIIATVIFFGWWSYRVRQWAKDNPDKEILE